MAHADRSLMRHVVGWLVAATVAACAPPASAQETRPLERDHVDFLTRYDFHLSAAALSNDDQRFSWDTHFGGDLDAVDYIVGRTSFRLDYEAVLGNELRAFDPNQGNYLLEASTSLRSKVAEVALVFHHVSRHLGDRDKTTPIAWNILGIRVLKTAGLGSNTVAMELNFGRVVQHSFVDYRWVGDASVVVRRPVVRRASLYASGSGDVLGVDAALNARGTQAG